MKKYFLVLALCCATAFAGCEKDSDIATNDDGEGIDIPSDTTAAFPDPIFRTYVLNRFDIDGDGKISKKEAAAVKTIIVTNYSISIKSLEGIQYFPNLTTLSCMDNQLTALDVSQNTQLKSLYCDDNKITSLDLSNNTSLTELSCVRNLLTTLDISQTNIGNSLELYPLCLYGMYTLETLYLKTGWSINGITYRRWTEYIPSQTEIIFVD